MKWFLAKLVYQITTITASHRPQFDVQWRLIQADELSWAREKALIMGSIGAFTFNNTRQEIVEWKFVDVIDIVELPSLSDGEQIYSATEEPEEVDLYLEIVKWKAKRVKDRSMQVTVKCE